MQSYQGIQHSCSGNFNRRCDSLCLSTKYELDPLAPGAWERTRLACTPYRETMCTLEACGPRHARQLATSRPQVFIRSGEPQDHGNFVVNSYSPPRHKDIKDDPC